MIVIYELLIILFVSMESKKIKKLVLKKETISTLSEDGMNELKGGSWGSALGFNSCCDCPVSTGCATQGQSCGTCGGATGYGMCCNNATLYCAYK